MSKLTQARLKELLHYNPLTGVFTWNTRPRGPAKAGWVAGCAKGKGYITICVDGVQHLAHRLAYLYIEGTFPTALVDHRDTNPHNNCWSNLRKATQAQNLVNRGPQTNNSLGCKCVVYRSKKFVVQVNGKYVGRLVNVDQALVARDIVVRELHGEFAHVG